MTKKKEEFFNVETYINERIREKLAKKHGVKPEDIIMPRIIIKF